MRKLVFITQQVDPDHPALGATVAKIAALAARADRVVVLADQAVPGALPAGCSVRTFAAPGKLGRGLRFAAALAQELPGLRGGAVVAHMCPIYAVLAAPLARPLRVPLLLWFTHWRASRLLRLAERLSTQVVSVDTRSFPLSSSKLTAIGHGIDLREFHCRARPAAGDGLRLLALGRYSPAKGLDVVLEAVRLARDERALDVRLDAYGPALSELEREHRRELERLVEKLGLAEHVRLRPAVPRAEVPALLAAADLLVNNMQAGAPDKVVYEAAASCLPVVASNPVFDGLLEPSLRFSRDVPAELAERLVGFAGLDAEARAQLGRELRERVARSHSVDSWADGLMRLVDRR